MKNLKVRAPLAFKIAGVDPQRFNEAVAAGLYECAPPGGRGAPRIFDVNDLIALTFYGARINLGLTPRVAGEEVCSLRREILSKNHDAEVAFCVKNALGSIWWNVDDSGQQVESLKSGLDVVFVEKWNVGAVRSYVERLIAEEANVIG